MNINHISEIIKSFIEDSSFKSILIDGPWGCGKTHIINETIKANKKLKIYYLSLFGLESIDEINTALYEITRTKKNKIVRFLKRETIVLTKAIKAIPQIPNISDALEYQLSITSTKNVKSSSIIVLDDLERLSNAISYSDLLGYINSLFLSNCRFICLISTQNIKDTSRQIDFNDFKEKIFYRIYKINETNYDIFKNIYKNYDLNLNLEIYDLFEFNIRIAQKIELFYKNILNRLNDKKINLDKLGLNKEFLFKACIYTINLVFKKFEECKPTGSHYDEIMYDSYVEYYGENIANGLYFYKKNDKYRTDFTLPKFNDTVRSLINVFYFNDYNNFDEIMFSNITIEEKDSILDKEFYYLSDENKKLYIKEFENILNTKQFEWNKHFVDILKSILALGTYVFSNEQINILAEKIYSTKKDENIDLRLEFLNEGQNFNYIQNFIINLSEKLIILRTNNFINIFTEYYKNEDYNKLIEILNKLNICNTEEKKSMLNYIVSNDFFMPDISQDIDYYIWSYCHEMAKFAQKNNVGEKFIDYAKSICENPSSECQIDRYQALIFYNIDENTKITNNKEELQIENI